MHGLGLRAATHQTLHKTEMLLVAWIMKWLVVRTTSIIGGIALYLYASLEHPAMVIRVQETAKVLTQYVGGNLEDKYAVWLPNLNLEASLTFLLFVLLSLLLIEGTLTILRRLWKAARALFGLR